MTSNHAQRKVPAGALIVSTLVCFACSETQHSTGVENPVPVIAAALIVSDSAPPVGGSVVVSVRAIGEQTTVASYTARITYDATGLKYDAEIPLEDDALRASNSVPGLLRFAGAASAGFTNAQLAAYRFSVLKANSVRTLSLSVDEIHTVTRLDAKPRLSVRQLRISR